MKNLNFYKKIPLVFQLKNLLFLFFLFDYLSNINAQNIGYTNYQIVVRNENNEVLVEKFIDLKISILDLNEIKFEESHSVKTNKNGLVSIIIGNGKISFGSLENISLGASTYFVKSEYKLESESIFKHIETSQLMTVPSAKFAFNGIPEGAQNGQILTNCEGIVRWTNYGTECPPIFDQSDCPSKLSNGTLFVGEESNDAVFTVKTKNKFNYTYPMYSVTSFNDTNLVAKTEKLDNSSNLTFKIYGKPKFEGPIGFKIEMGENSCFVNLKVTNPDSLLKIGGGITDKFGNFYNTLIIDKDEWMAQNLIVSNYTNNFEYPQHISSIKLDTTIDDCIRKITSNLINVCPTGWHVPSNNDWLNLKLYLGHYFNDPKFSFDPKGKLFDYTFTTFERDTNWNYISTKNQIRNFVEPENGYWWSSDFSWSNKIIDNGDWMYSYKVEINYVKQEKNNNVLQILQEKIEDINYDCLDYFDNELQSKLAGMHANVRCIKNK